ncbi:sensor histidine kinase [Pseudobacter ginsenosidimutans]|uniref:histidine kinase n=1 Tax=Pseudobacter ginsenosidimutans TaxID=661488 RepID=A0A4Q7MTB4_9BACT|nr:ATP-binding protein [Pseudobacter ginsenosidimutans]QEC41147.1 two-component sensor histidine kinase [Pseudobacter ginsenosidimutans]RZS72092.1 phospho-acceptor domain-containing protein [Pseudobacter ginsenosidimutans]
MKASRKSRLFLASLAYWFLLVYIVAALVFWFFELNQQSDQMASYKISALILDDPDYLSKYEKIQDERKRKSAQFLGEGITFLVLTLLGAFYVYRAVRKQIKLQQQQQHFMMAVTHELKTPIAVAKLNLETLLKHQLDDQKKNKLLSMTLEETNRLNTLANNILVSSQLEGGRYRIAREEIDFSSLVQSAVQDFINRFPARKWITNIQADTELNGDPLLLQILVNNLVENAVKYSPKTAAIECRLFTKGKTLVLQVADEGPGIPDNEKNKVFEKFYRIGNENTRTAKGTGLGLFLCRKIAEDHRATIRVTDNTPTGCIFTVSFTL